MRNDLSMNQSRPTQPRAFRPAQLAALSVHGQARNAREPQKAYEHYLVLAEAKALAGDRIEAENYYQHAEHYLRLMAENRL